MPKNCNLKYKSFKKGEENVIKTKLCFYSKVKTKYYHKYNYYLQLRKKKNTENKNDLNIPT